MSACAQPLELAIELNFSLGGDVDARTPRGPALVVEGDWVQGHMRVRVLDVAAQYGDVAAEGHRPDAGLVQQLEELSVELGDPRTRVRRSHRPPDRLFRD